jgi:hypothetical protein
MELSGLTGLRALVRKIARGSPSAVQADNPDG